MSTRGGRGGGGGGRRGAGDFTRGGGRGRGSGDFTHGRGRGGGRGGGRGYPPRRDPPIADVRSAPPPTRRVASYPSSSSADPSTLSRGVEGLSIMEAETKPLAITAMATEVTAVVPSSSQAMKHPRRPEHGTLGRKCNVLANHFLVVVEDCDLNHYDVAITPELTSKAACRKIISQLVTLYKDSHLGGLTPAYDGRKSLYTARPLPFTSQAFKIKLNDSRDRDEEYNVAIKHVGQPNLDHLMRFLQGTQFDAPQETIQALDIVLRQLPTQNCVTVSRSFFSKEFGAATAIGDGLECWPGYYQSLRPTQMGLSLNIDISATAFYKHVSVLEFAAESLGLRVSRPLTDKQHADLKKALRGLRAEVTHTHTQRRYKITGITSESLNKLTFPMDDNGTRMSVVQYFQNRYQRRLEHVHWPCLQAGSDAKPTYLPMEVCNIVEGQRYTKKLNEKQVTQILRATCQCPQTRQESVLKTVHKNNYANDNYAIEFGIKVVNSMALVEARVLPPPMLKYHDSGREKTCNPKEGSWNMINKRLVNGGSIQSWACISFSGLCQKAVHRFCQSLFSVCGNIGMTIVPDPAIKIMCARDGNIEGALRKAHSQATAATKDGALKLLLIVLPETSGSYGTIKRVCETDLGIVSQCCKPKHVQECRHQYMENVALKINVKVGGRNTVLDDALRLSIPLVTDRPTIIFGADVTHPPPGEDCSPSIAAVVASMDWPEVTTYRALVSAQAGRKEIIKDLFTVTQDPQKGTVYGGMITEFLVAFKELIGNRPERIIFYRDGVSEGQFSTVLQSEVDAIRKACASLEKGYQPPITFVVVQKRHHTRLFPENQKRKNTDKKGNILPGTVVDRKITHPTEFDFFLCSHAGIQGTSRPTHYHVLLDENKFTADILQSLTNNLCYTYARCTRSVSVVPPAYYAHLAAFRARHYVQGYSERGSGSAGGGSNEVKPLPRIKDKVKEVMFYC